VEELARELKEEFSANAESRASGMVIDTMGFIVREGYAVILASFSLVFLWTNIYAMNYKISNMVSFLNLQLLLHAIRTFNASLVIVVGQVMYRIYFFLA